jgi:putative FmdB family regulatory protein
MPIYAYKCESCGHAKDVLQKVSDEPLTTCPACGAPTFRKQLTAAVFPALMGTAAGTVYRFRKYSSGRSRRPTLRELKGDRGERS